MIKFCGVFVDGKKHFCRSGTEIVGLLTVLSCKRSNRVKAFLVGGIAKAAAMEDYED